MADAGLRAKVEKVIENRVRPGLARDGGDIELVAVDEASGEVRVRLQGACAGCPMSQMTLTMVVEEGCARDGVARRPRSDLQTRSPAFNGLVSQRDQRRSASSERAGISFSIDAIIPA